MIYFNNINFTPASFLQYVENEVQLDGLTNVQRSELVTLVDSLNSDLAEDVQALVDEYNHFCPNP